VEKLKGLSGFFSTLTFTKVHSFPDPSSNQKRYQGPALSNSTNNAAITPLLLPVLLGPQPLLMLPSIVV
jgi:hypothetical protein